MNTLHARRLYLSHRSDIAAGLLTIAFMVAAFYAAGQIARVL